MNARTSLEVVRLTGELDIARKDELHAALTVRANARAVLLDLAEVTYADSTALSELLRFSIHAKETQIPVALLVVTPQFSRVIRYAGLDHAFEVFDNRGDALTYLEQAS